MFFKKNCEKAPKIYQTPYMSNISTDEDTHQPSPMIRWNM